MIKRILLLSFFSIVGVSEAAIFGDGDASNGVEDSRVAITRSDNSGYLNYVGTVVCDRKVRGTGILLSVSSGEMPARPFLLTAAHVLVNDAGQSETKSVVTGSSERCGYLTRSNPWEYHQIVGEFIKGEYFGGGAVGAFGADWLVVGLDPWVNWGQHAIPFSLAMDVSEMALEPKKSAAIFVGYDTASNRLLIDEDCALGFQAGSGSQARNSENPVLAWDDCDSESGSSGGALLVLREGEPQLIGIRVGNLFDAEMYPEGPRQGDRFDLNANINVSRLVNRDIQLAIQELVSGEGSP